MSLLQRTCRQECNCVPPLSERYKMKKNKGKYGLAVILLSCVLFYLSFGFFVVQPLGAVPEGKTVFYFRLGTGLPFVCSADGMLEKNGKGVSIFGRLGAMAGIVERMEGRIILRLPYSKQLYLISTGGKEYER
jgi:hypothetical protein